MNTLNSDWNEDSIYLPKEDSYMFADEGEFADDISYYSTLIKVCYDENYYKNISKKLETINQGFESITSPCLCLEIYLFQVK